MDDAPLSVKRLLEQIKARIEAPFSAVCVVGEVSNLRTSGKHWYFTLKEEGAALQCAVWAGSQRLLGHTPRDGERVVLKGSLNLYVAGGSLTLAVTHCEKAGAGDLQARLRQLEAELRAEGLFDRPTRPLPRFPKRIGVVAALGGAALRDVLEVCSKRAPGLDLLIAPAAAQGDRCIPENLSALQEIQDEHWGCDAILLVRGGGSLEDLWAFNDPRLVRAVAGCRLPIVTGVGHEIDTTLVDLAADIRAATPSHAALVVTPDLAALKGEVERRENALLHIMQWRLRGLESTLNLLSDSPGMHAVPQALDRTGVRLVALSHRLKLAGSSLGTSVRLADLHLRLHLAHPRQKLDQTSHKLGILRQRMLHASELASGESTRPRLLESLRRLDPAVMNLLWRRHQRLDLLKANLVGLDPTGPLSRGFVLAKDGRGRPITSASAVHPGEVANLQWLDGERTARFEK
ncbi:MAG: exodeoxyribonuclease VII large subunit [Holophagaceae bacterium]|nr:exodeoxyribonuclease VII large subunit [Holophagaceae bacterium]